MSLFESLDRYITEAENKEALISKLQEIGAKVFPIKSIIDSVVKVLLSMNKAELDALENAFRGLSRHSFAESVEMNEGLFDWMSSLKNKAKIATLVLGFITLFGSPAEAGRKGLETINNFVNPNVGEKIVGDIVNDHMKKDMNADVVTIKHFIVDSLPVETKNAIINGKEKAEEINTKYDVTGKTKKAIELTKVGAEKTLDATKMGIKNLDKWNKETGASDKAVETGKKALKGLGGALSRGFKSLNK